MVKFELKTDRCKGCLLCLSACKLGLLEKSDKLNALGHFPCRITDSEKCIGCAMCAIVCPDSIISIYKD